MVVFACQVVGVVLLLFGLLALLLKLRLLFVVVFCETIVGVGVIEAVFVGLLLTVLFNVSFVDRCLLFAVCCCLFTVCCLLFAVRCFAWCLVFLVLCLLLLLFCAW